MTFGRDVWKAFPIERLAPKTLGRRANLRLLRQANLPLMAGVSRLWTLVFKGTGLAVFLRSQKNGMSLESRQQSWNMVKPCEIVITRDGIDFKFFIFQDVSQLFPATSCNHFYLHMQFCKKGFEFCHASGLPVAPPLGTTADKRQDVAPAMELCGALTHTCGGWNPLTQVVSRWGR